MYLGVSTSAAFDAAVQEFQDSLDDDDNHYNLTQFRSINDVYDEADRIQREQGTKGALRDLNRIKPFLERLLEFAGVIDVIVQVKPDVLALIWVCRSCDLVRMS